MCMRERAQQTSCWNEMDPQFRVTLLALQDKRRGKGGNVFFFQNVVLLRMVIARKGRSFLSSGALSDKEQHLLLTVAQKTPENAAFSKPATICCVRSGGFYPDNFHLGAKVHPIPRQLPLAPNNRVILLTLSEFWQRPISLKYILLFFKMLALV